MTYICILYEFPNPRFRIHILLVTIVREKKETEELFHFFYLKWINAKQIVPKLHKKSLNSGNLYHISLHTAFDVCESRKFCNFKSRVFVLASDTLESDLKGG